jgi:hypothetical protein
MLAFAGSSKGLVLFVNGVSIVNGIFLLGVGIFDAYAVSTSTDARDESCGYSAWNAILLCAIFQLLECVLLGVQLFLAFVAREEDTAMKVGAFSTFVVSLPMLAFAIWTVVIFFNVSNDCSTLYEDKYPDLWMAVKLEMIVFFIELGLSCVLSCAKIARAAG